MKAAESGMLGVIELCMVEARIPRTPRDYRVKFPEDVQEDLAG